MLYKRSAKQLRRKLQLEKHRYMVNALIRCMKGIQNLFTQRTLNTNKICIIPALVNKETNLVARSDTDKAYILARHLQNPPKNDIIYKVAISKPLELADDFICLSDVQHSDITKEEVIEVPYKAQGPDNINNQMLKNGGNKIIESLVFLF
ncbi:hypothetical protein RFI_28429 [Reticulomyxa filosa]|uniref:Uncharacterized protein n=1 Tax=Reticulomyxa filosa TaxID=46433 RepID=X6M4Q0_RETFI|nr:hypothetical protein RFI_28429 [Reticulomyxa filosa]|eukprot:ETO08958.1 hypothetical protein RFI_28429 [Reticulomyxa filosa]